jgi:hypothetical protein
MTISGEGKVGIGFTPSYKLQVAGEITTHAGTNTSYYAYMNYLGTTYNFGPGETSDNVDFKIAGGATFATGGNFRWFTQAGNSTPLERMKISAAGIVTKPYHPVFHVSRSAGNVSGGTTVIWNVVYTNVGSYYNSSNGRFTAPVAGAYYFAFSVMSDGDVGMDMQVEKNGVVFQGCVPLQSAIGSTYNQLTGVCTITLAAGDYVTVYNSSGTIYAGNANGGRHTMFCGFLVG